MVSTYIICVVVVSVLSFIGGMLWTKADNDKIIVTLRSEIRANIEREMKYVDTIRSLQRNVNWLEDSLKRRHSENEKIRIG